MPISKNFSKSPFEVNHPNDRWKPDLGKTGENNIQRFYAPLVQSIRKEIFDWRQFGYEGISDTSKSLLDYWFNSFHEKGFQYYFGQRESVESVIYLFEKIKVRDSQDLLKINSQGLSNNQLKYSSMAFS